MESENVEVSLVLQRKVTTDFINNELPETAFSRTFPAAGRIGKAEIGVLSASRRQERLENMRLVTIQFEQSITNFRKSSCSKDVAAKDYHAQNIQDVIFAMTDVDQEYHREDTLGQRVRAVFRRLSTRAESVMPMLELLPDGAYKTLCGGLKLVVKAMMRHVEIREKIADLLETLPDESEDMAEYLDTYNESFYHERIKARMEDVFISMMQVLERIVTWYTQHAMKRFVKNFLQGPQFGKQIDIGLIRLAFDQRKLEKELRKCLHQRVGSIEREVVQTRAAILRMQEDGKETLDGVRKLTKVLDGRLRDLDYNQWMNKARDEADVDQMISEVHAMTLAKQIGRQLLETERPATQPSAGYTAAALLDALDLTKEVVHTSDTVTTAIKYGDARARTFQKCSSWLANNAAFQNWIQLGRSEILLVEGHGPLERISPMTYIAGLLAYRFEAEPNALVLTYFCSFGELRSSESPAVLIARSLLSKVLSLPALSNFTDQAQHRVFATIDKQRLRKLQRGSTKSYLAVLRSALSVLRGYFSKLFILVDGVEFFEQADLAEMKLLYECMLDVASMPEDAHVLKATWGSKSTAGVVKILCSSSTKSGTQSVAGGRATYIQVPDSVEIPSEHFDRIAYERRTSDRDYVDWDRRRQIGRPSEAEAAEQESDEEEWN